jgi:hypothetical protein
MSPIAAPATHLSMDVFVAELDAIGHRIDDGLPPAQRGRIAALRAPGRDPESAVRAPMPDRALIMLALIDDCLRAVHRALVADGRVGADELDHVFPLVFVAAGRYGRALARYQQFTAVDGDLAAEFLRLHRSDRRPLGHACRETEWLGLALCKATAAATGQKDVLADYERMTLRLLDEVIAFDGVTVEEREVRAAFARELAARLVEGGVSEGDGRDPRVVAFCQNGALDVFGSVAQPAHVHERDPFDVGTIHAHARQVFDGLLTRATTPTRQDRGRILVVRGEAGSGKTHLMRAFRASAHGLRLGYCGYAALTSDTGDYARYLLAHLVDSLEKPYDRPTLERQALGYLSDGLAELGDVITPDEIERLRNEDMEPDRLGSFVGGLVDRLLRAHGFAEVDVDVLQAVLLVQRGDPAVTKRVVKFLRCEDLNAHDRALIGGLAPRLEAEAPLRMIVQLGRLMWATQQAALVVLVDQIEDIYDLEATRDRYRRAVAALRAISERLPSSVVVLACLDDLWNGLRERIPRADLDRLEHDPPPVVLRAQRNFEEIEALVARRLENLYAEQNVVFRADEPFFPFRREQLEPLVNLRTRDVLQACKAIHERAIVRRELGDGGESSGPEASPPVSLPLAELDRQWNAFRATNVPVPDEPEALLALLAGAADALAHELPLGAMLRAVPEGDFLVVESSAIGEAPVARLVGLTNKGTQAGALGKQIDALAKAQGGRAAVAVRTSEFKIAPKTKSGESLAAFVSKNGRKLVVDNDAFRTMVALTAFVQRGDVKPHAEAWQRAARPLSTITALRDLFELERLAVVPTAPVAAVGPAPLPPPPPSPPLADRPLPLAATPPAADRLRVGTTASLRGEPVEMSLEQLKQHAVFLGSTGSGKTTIALNLIEQLVERGVPALLVDRKGDLCRYASPEWWDEVPADAAQARRKAALRARVDVRLFTPGETRGRNLILPLLPAGIGSAHEQEREKIAKYCAASLASLMSYGQSEAHQKRAAVLKAAFEVHADASLTISDLIEAVSRPEGELLLRTDSLQKYFKQLVEDLQTLRISFGHLLTASGESLDVGSLLAPQAGRTALTIVSTKFLGERSSLVFWVARLLVEISRYLEQHPRPELQAVGFFDEADLYLPATSSPATKEPMMDLLRRARSKGFGVLLASQNPGDFDYKGRENINTWFVGRVAQERSIAKMRDLLGDYPNVSGLANQPRGQFFMLESRGPREVRADRNLCETRELTQEEILHLARNPAR